MYVHCDGEERRGNDVRPQVDLLHVRRIGVDGVDVKCVAAGERQLGSHLLQQHRRRDGHGAAVVVQQQVKLGNVGVKLALSTPTAHATRVTQPHDV